MATTAGATTPLIENTNQTNASLWIRIIQEGLSRAAVRVPLFSLAGAAIGIGGVLSLNYLTGNDPRESGDALGATIAIPVFVTTLFGFLGYITSNPEDQQCIASHY